jgi:hypothetical protein
MDASSRSGLARLLLLVATIAVVACGRGDALVPSDVDTSVFDGRYRLKSDASFRRIRAQIAGATDAKARENLERILARQLEQYASFRIHHGVIRSGGGPLVQEFSLITASIQGKVLQGRAEWHEDVQDPGDSTQIPILMRLQGRELEFVQMDAEGRSYDAVVLVRDD